MQEVLEFSRRAFPALADMLQVFGSRQIRNVATIGGNIGTASPIGDTLPVLIALRAKIELAGPLGMRRIPIDTMLRSYRETASLPGELITRVIIPVQPADARVKSYKVSRRHDLDIATVSAGFRLATDGQDCVREVFLAFGGMAEMTRRAVYTEGFLTGKRWTRSVVEDAMDILAQEFTPLTDVRGSAAFRTTIARNLLLRFWDDVRE
jgi:xanthine dehydrogenase small subunit